jgi:hypothetical protein
MARGDSARARDQGPESPAWWTGDRIVAAIQAWAERTPIDEYSNSELLTILNWIQSDTLLRTEEDLLAEAMRELGFERCGKKIVSRITWAIRAVRAA